MFSRHGRETATHLWCTLADFNSRAVQVLERDSCIAQLRDELACSRQAHAADTARLNAQSSLAAERADQLEQIQKQRTQEKVRSMVSLLPRPLACCEVQTMTRTYAQHVQQSQTHRSERSQQGTHFRVPRTVRCSCDAGIVVCLAAASRPANPGACHCRCSHAHCFRRRWKD